MPRKLSTTGRKLRTVKRKALRGRAMSDTHMPPYVGQFSDIQQQVYLEYNLDWNFMRPKIQKWLLRLKLYNNQRRDEEKVGEPLIYETHQTTMSVLYSDKMEVEFTGREEDDEDQADNLNILAINDYDEMEKDKLDYEWDWDSGFFGSGLCLFNDFDTISKTPVPTIIDPTTFVMNPGCVWINGNRAGEGALLHGGYEVKLTKAMMRANMRTKNNPNGYFNLSQLQKTTDLYSLSGESSRLRREANGTQDIYTFENQVTTNYEYSILRWFTHVYDAETKTTSKYIVEMGNNRMLPIRVIKLERNFWPIVQRKFSPISHDFHGVSIPDLTEDKQRFKAKMLNVAGDTAMADVNGMYLFKEDRFKKTQDFNFRFGKWLPVKGAGPLQDAAIPLQTKQVSETVKYVLSYLDNSAKSATATQDVAQGNNPAPSNTLGETQIQVQGISGRHGLTAKVWGWSEKEFWRQWYFIYEDNYDDALGAKMASLEGAFNTKWIPLKRADIITGNTLGPKIKVQSKSITEAAKTRDYQMLNGFAQTIAADPTVNVDKTYLYRKLGRLLIPKQEIERIIPLSVDEYQALEENKKLNDEEMVRVNIAENHQVHLRVHASADDNPVTRRHIQMHIYMLMQKRTSPSAFPQMPGEQDSGAQLTPTPNAQPNANNQVKQPVPSTNMQTPQQ